MIVCRKDALTIIKNQKRWTAHTKFHVNLPSRRVVVWTALDRGGIFYFCHLCHVGGVSRPILLARAVSLAILFTASFYWTLNARRRASSSRVAGNLADMVATVFTSVASVDYPRGSAFISNDLLLLPKILLSRLFYDAAGVCRQNHSSKKL